MKQLDYQFLLTQTSQMNNLRSLRILFVQQHFGGKVVEALWTRIMDDYGHVDDEPPSFAISLYKEYRGQGIGSQLMVKMKWKGHERASLAMQKANYAVKMYKDVGCKTVDENAKEYIMVCDL